MRRSILNIFGTEAVLESKTTLDQETLTPVRSIPIKIKCHKYGKLEFIRDDKSFEEFNAQCYLVPAEIVEQYDIKRDDLIDGQPVKIVKESPIPKGRIRKFEQKLYAIYTYNKG